MRLVAIGLMLVVAFFSGWFLLLGLAAASGVFCSGGDDCVSRADELAPVLGVLLLALSGIALLGLATRRVGTTAFGGLGHAAVALVVLAVALGEHSGGSEPRDIAVACAVAGVVLAVDLMAVFSVLRGKRAGVDSR